MGLNCVSPFTQGFFSVVHTTVLQDQWLVESRYVEPWIWKADYKLYADFQLS